MSWAFYLFDRDTKIDEAFNAWRVEIVQSGESVLSMVLKNVKMI